MFLLITGESLDIKISYFSESLKPWLSQHRIVKSIKLGHQSVSNMRYTYVLTRSYFKMVVSFAIVSNVTVTARNLYTMWNCSSLRMTSLKRKREERRFVDIRIILLLHCGGEFLKQVLNFCFKVDGNVPRYGSTIKWFFSGTSSLF